MSDLWIQGVTVATQPIIAQVVGALATFNILPTTEFVGIDELRLVVQNSGAGAGRIDCIHFIDPPNPAGATISVVVPALSAVTVTFKIFTGFVRINFVETGGVGTTIAISSVLAYPGK